MGLDGWGGIDGIRYLERASELFQIAEVIYGLQIKDELEATTTD